MGMITTHILDISAGRPAAGVSVILEHKTPSEGWVTMGESATDDDGRCRKLFADPAHSVEGHYRLTFETGAYFAGQGIEPFFPQVTIVFTVRDRSQHFHVPLLLSPFGYSTYRGT